MSSYKPVRASRCLIVEGLSHGCRAVMPIRQQYHVRASEVRSAQATSTLPRRCRIASCTPRSVAGKEYLPITKSSRDPPKRVNSTVPVGRAPGPPAVPAAATGRSGWTATPLSGGVALALGAGAHAVAPVLSGPPRLATGLARAGVLLRAA